MEEKSSTLTTERKALTVNLDDEKYGSFAEIGAGQEVARYFFKVGAAAGTVAKSISAYDMKFSDAIYGKASRYVSRDRLNSMMDYEYNLLEERLKENRGASTCFFSFADTVAAQGYQKKGECHGWMGVRFQLRPQEAPNNIIIHVRMLDSLNLQQQEALGIIGVNLIYGAFYYHNDPDRFIASLADNLSNERIEVDMIAFDGPDFENVDNRLLSLKLVQNSLTNAVMFNKEGKVIQPSEALYKQAIMVERGSFRPITKVNIDMLECSGAQFVQEEQVQGEDVTVLMELTMNNLCTFTGQGQGIEAEDFLARVDTLNALGYTVLISNYFEYYRLISYFRRYTHQMIGIVLGINNLLEIFNEFYYEDLDGGILEAFGRLFKEQVKLYVYPMKGAGFSKYTSAHSDKNDGPDLSDEVLITAQNLQVKTHLRNLYSYLMENHYIEPVNSYRKENMHIYSRDIFKKLKSGDPEWEEAVPTQVAKIIKKRGLWGYGKEAKEPAKSE